MLSSFSGYVPTLVPTWRSKLFEHTPLVSAAQLHQGSRQDRPPVRIWLGKPCERGRCWFCLGHGASRRRSSPLMCARLESRPYAPDRENSASSLSSASVTASATGLFPVSISDSRDGWMPASRARSYWVKPARIRLIFSSNPSISVPLEVVPSTVIC